MKWGYEQMRRETRADMAALLTSYLEDAQEALRRALSRNGDSLLDEQTRIPDSVAGLLAEARVLMLNELRRRRA